MIRGPIALLLLPYALVRQRVMVEGALFFRVFSQILYSVFGGIGLAIAAVIYWKTPMADDKIATLAANAASPHKPHEHRGGTASGRGVWRSLAGGVVGRV